MEGALKDCPFPEVAKALQPYIKSRQEAQDIRRGLQASLPVSPLDTSRSAHPDINERGGLTGVRKAYLRALQAHRSAQERYDSLKTELDKISQTGSGQGAQTDGTFLNESYVPLVRQREKRRKLDVIDKTLATIATTGEDVVSSSFDKVVKREVGELPHPPSTAGYADRELGSDADYDVTRLKKAILATQQEIEEHEQASVQANGVADGDVNPVADLKALQKTHNELTTWMEKQLAMISDLENTKDGDNSAHSAPDHHHPNEEAPAFSLTDIESLYEQYLDSRQRLLEIVSTQEQDSYDSPPSSPESSRRSVSGILESDTTTIANTSELLLPYLTRLTHTKQSEQSLLQQTGFMRRQISTAESRTQEMLGRLADESHLVQPEHRRGEPQARDWKVAAEEASATTLQTAMKKLQTGEVAAESAARSLDAIQSMPRSIESLTE
ncbi:hypothetical protein CB0940_04205 [Cercospora beticola]|uniref:Uncharacterized protein n=1 Tax=Cercospora beticola TaxID=122368 RepID=A0A2G5HJT6_CERBT|nr:hypothetical protein CB0940_04205 [Cercospora beticola]PIA92826.1 hypothetical protein CB0940_04205 [Cercospora beticola]WPB01424.1 hypothetical protein RHO25_006050 [Cercospora beticola]